MKKKEKLKKSWEKLADVLCEMPSRFEKMRRRIYKADETLSSPPSFQDFIKKRLEPVVIVVIASYPIDLQRISMTARQKSLVIRCHIPIISDNE